MRITASLMLAAALTSAAAGAGAADLSGMYDPGTLSYWGQRFPVSTTRLFNAVRQNLLHPDEAASLEGTRLEFPPIAPGRCPQHCFSLFDFYSSSIPPPPEITLPIFSILFMNDLMIAYAWLRVNGYDIETVTNYLAMLRFRPASDFPSGYPPPLTALHIPGEALDDARVNRMSLSLFNDARAFVLGHEMGHIQAHDRGNRNLSPEESQMREQRADAFALEILKRDHNPPVGMVVYFTAITQFDPARAGTHPLTPQRLLAIADDLNRFAPEFAAGDPADLERVKLLSQQLRILAVGIPGKGGGLADAEVQASERIVGLSTTVDSLYPRRPGESLSSEASARTSTEAFAGTYRGTYRRQLSGQTESLPMVAVLERTGSRVHGRFSFGLGDGTLDAIVIGNVAELDWAWGGTVGKGELRATPDGKGFTGTWGYAQSRSGGGSWEGQRR